MKHAIMLVVCAVAFCLVSAPAAAHEITFKGTVASVENGKTLKVTVTVVDEKTKKPKPMIFEIDDETRHRLLNGLDDIALTLQQGDAIDAYERERERSGPVTTAL